MPQANAQRTEETEPSPSGARRPEATAKVGNVEIAVWRNQGASGDQWKDGSSYNQLDLLALAEAAREASAKIRELSKGRAQGR
jgi:hypothetical protein